VDLALYCSPFPLPPPSPLHPNSNLQKSGCPRESAAIILGKVELNS